MLKSEGPGGGSMGGTRKSEVELFLKEGDRKMSGGIGRRAVLKGNVYHQERSVIV